MAEEPDQQGRLELQYRAGREDLRSVSEEDQGCAVFFAFIAIAMLGGIVALILPGWGMGGGRLLDRALLIAGLGLFAGLSIIAVCGRLTRHRWWGNRHWKEFLPRDRRKNGG
jgi:hypothetical protein